MKNCLFFIFATSLLFSACQQNTEASAQMKKLQEQLTEQNNLLEQAKIELAKCKTTDEKLLVHTVYFKLKSNISSKENIELVKEINKLNKIDVLKNLEIGTFQDLEDSRALSDYQLVMQMEFSSIEDYQIYQAHDIHLHLKKQAGKYLAGPPATYDYWTE